MLLVSSALAGVAIPIGDAVINIGEIPQWFIAIAAAGVLYKVWKTEQHTAESLGKIEQVRHETNSMRSALELASKAEGRLAGRQEMREETAAANIIAKETARVDAVADAQNRADVRAADPKASATLPVTVPLTLTVDKAREHGQ